MPDIQGLNTVINFLRSKAAAAAKGADVSVIVGYTARYAVYVHEDTEMKLRGKPRKGKGHRGLYWDPQGQGQAKFLEAPARYLSQELGRIAAVAVKARKTLAQGLVLAGLRLQRESQRLVPIEFSLLKASAFTRLETRQ